jgi:hypothetical protein
MAGASWLSASSGHEVDMSVSVNVATLAVPSTTLPAAGPIPALQGV